MQGYSGVSSMIDLFSDKLHRFFKNCELEYSYIVVKDENCKIVYN